MPVLPSSIDACLFDMDGVLTDTASVHAQAWKATFDPVLEARGEPPFDPASDYTAYVDGKSRSDGVRSFLESRGIHLEDGDPDDPPDADTVNGVGNRKNVLLLRVMDEQGVEAYEGSKRFVEALRERGLKSAIVSSSANAEKAVLAAGYPPEWFDARVDGVTLKEDPTLKGKPAPDSFLRAAELLGVPKERCAVLEDALAGVEAGRAGDFGWVVGVDRADQAEALAAHGADVVIGDLAELELGPRA